MFGQDNRNDAPVKNGEEHNVKIEGTGRNGDGIAKIEGFIIFVPNTNEGDEVKIRITETKRNLAFAELITE